MNICNFCRKAGKPAEFMMFISLFLCEGESGFQKLKQLGNDFIVVRFINVHTRVNAEPFFVVGAGVRKLEHRQQIVEEKGEKPWVKILAHIAAGKCLGNRSYVNSAGVTLYFPRKGNGAFAVLFRSDFIIKLNVIFIFP